MTTLRILERAAVAKAEVAALSTDKKREALIAMAESIERHNAEILCANRLDVDDARSVFSSVMLDRLELNAARITAMSEGIKQVAVLPDPIGNVSEEITRPNGLNIKKISVPLGVVAIIYESRPNVTSDAAALSLMSGNACVLRTGKEAHRSAMVIVEAMRNGLEEVGVTKDAVQLVDDTSRGSATELMQATGYVDLLIPRGGDGLIKACVNNAKVPCIQTGTGVCHVYVDAGADFGKALKIIENAKCSRPSVCNAMEVCLVDKTVAPVFLPMLWEKLYKNRDTNPVTFALDAEAAEILNGCDGCVSASADDFDREFLDYKMAVAVVGGVDGAIKHVAEHSTGHSDCIITESAAAAEKFTRAVDSAAVYVNASTRFTDGGEFGLGCEMGISTQKLHARGPMGLRELTTYKYVIVGNGNIR